MNSNFIDGVNIFSFVLGLMNLDENLTQGDKQDLMNNLNQKSDFLLKEIHAHLQKQDEKIDKILYFLEKQ